MRQDLQGMMVVVGLLAVAAAHASGTLIIHPAGVFPEDVANIQAAVDELGQSHRDGVIILKARNKHGAPTEFHFGTSEDPFARGSVVVTDNYAGAVTFLGEHSHGVMTTIRGGFGTIRMQRDDDFAVKGVKFIGAQDCAVCVDTSTSVVIADSVFLDIEDTDPIANAIQIVGFDALASSGRVEVTGNFIDTINAGFSNAISIFNIVGPVTIEHNVTLNVSNGVRVQNFRRLTRIKNNYVVLETTPSDFNFDFGVLVGCGIGGKARAIITHNVVEAGAPDLISGIFVNGTEAVNQNGVPFECPLRNSIIAHNEVTFSGGQSPTLTFGLDIFAFGGGIRGNKFFGNRIRGPVAIGISLQGFPGGTFEPEIAENRVFENDLTDIIATDADALLNEFTRDNVYRGMVGETVLDFGTGNQIILRP